jgi:hypothetical protein
MKQIIMGMMMLFASLAVADDFKTVNGKEYKNATVTEVEPDGIHIRFSGGVVKLGFVDLPGDVQKRYGYNAQNAAAYVAGQVAAIEQANQQAAVVRQQRNEIAQEQQRQANERMARLRNAQALAAQYEALQAQEENLLMQIGHAEKAREDGWRRWVGNGLMG